MSVMPMTTTANPTTTYQKNGEATTTPACVVKVLGHAFVPVWAEMVRTWTGVSDTATVCVPRTDDVDWSLLLKAPTSNDGSVILEIYTGFPASYSPGSVDTSQLTRRFYGIVVPSYGFKATTDEITFSASSMAILLQVEKMCKVSRNQTTVQFIQSIANQIPGMTSEVDLGSQKALPLRAVMGREFVVGVHNIRPWDLAEASAQFDDAVLRVDQTVLKYKSPNAFNGAIQVYDYGTDLIDFEGTHAPQFSKNIEVEIRTWSPQTSYSYTTKSVTQSDGTVVSTSQGRISVTTPEFGTATATSSSTNAAGVTTTSTKTKSGGLFNTGFTTVPRDSSKERYIIPIYGLSKDEADQIRDQIYKRLSRYEYVVTFEVPVTPETHDVLGDMETQFELSKLPLAAFNNTQNYPYYHQRRTTERIEMPQGSGGSDGGWHIMTECVNHPNPTGGGGGL